MTDLNKFKARYDADVVATELTGVEPDQDVADYYNSDEVTPDVEVRATREQVRATIDVTEFKLLDTATRDAVRLVLLSDSIQIRDSNDRVILLDAFGPATTTRANLQTLQAAVEASVSRSRAQRGEFLGNSKAVTAYDVQFMRMR